MSLTVASGLHSYNSTSHLQNLQYMWLNARGTVTLQSPKMLTGESTIENLVSMCSHAMCHIPHTLWCHWHNGFYQTFSLKKWDDLGMGLRCDMLSIEKVRKVVTHVCLLKPSLTSKRGRASFAYSPEGIRYSTASWKIKWYENWKWFSFTNTFIIITCSHWRSTYAKYQYFNLACK